VTNSVSVDVATVYIGILANYFCERVLGPTEVTTMAELSVDVEVRVEYRVVKGASVTVIVLVPLIEVTVTA
jgi:hypothetical protein